MRAMTFLKSINIVEDLAHPVRAAHYRPTSKSLEILRSVLGLDGSAVTSVIATYGSGKSIAAMMGGLLVEGDHHKLHELAEAGDRLASFNPMLASRLEARRSEGRKGVVVALNGFVSDVPRAVSAFLGLEPCATMVELFERLEAHLKRRRADRLAIVWDEFGRHLESLVSRGRAEDLAQVQDLAEWVARRKAPSVTLTVLLHQEFHRYAGRLGQLEQAAWKKIEGRFEPLRIIEDSDEIYAVIADVAQDLTRSGRPRANEGIAAQALDLQLFPFLPDRSAALDLFRRAAPLTPAALYLLPKVAGRVGQNERSTFSFLGDELPEDRSVVVSIEDVWRYFADAMRTDTGVGGSHKRFVETEAARSRATSAVQREVLAATALLHLTASGTRALVSSDRLLKFLEIGTTHSQRALREAIQSLLARKLLLHRQLTDEVSVWQGSDVDVRARVEEVVEGLRNGSDTLARIARHVPAPAYLGPSYNHNKGMTRYAQGVFVDMATLRDPKRQEELGALADGSDALVALVVDGSHEDHESVRGRWLDMRRHLILAFAESRPELDAACLQAEALAELERDEHLLEMDPLVEREVKELKADALDYLVARAALLTDPEAGAVAWFSQGRCLGQGADLQVAEVVADVMERRFPMTPVVVNEQIVRRRVTAQTKSARKRLLLGILERARVPHLGYEEATTSDASLYRTTLEATRLFDGPTATWASPDDYIRLEPGMRLCWSLLRSFYAEPQKSPKPFSEIIQDLGAPPVGIRAGLLPVLITAGLRAFGQVLAIRRNVESRWLYLDDIQPSDMEEICESPGRFEIEVIATEAATRDLMRRVTAEFTAVADEVETDLVRAFYDAVTAWQRALPPAAMTARGLGAEAKALQHALRQTKGDPVGLLFRAFPGIAGRPTLDEETLRFVATARRQIEQLTHTYTQEAIRAARLAFGGDEGSGLVASAQTWAQRIPTTIGKGTTLDQVALGILNRARRATPASESDVGFVRILAGMLVGRTFDKWSDTEARTFAKDLRSRLREIEDAVLALDASQEGVAPFLEQRIEDYMRKLKGAASPAEMQAFVEKLREGLQ